MTEQAQIVIKRPDPMKLITGRVVDEEGEPLARITVHAKNEGSQWPTGRSMSRLGGWTQTGGTGIASGRAAR